MSHPFPVSQAIIDWCKEDVQAEGENQCKRLSRGLENMSYEQQDALWAPAMEKKLLASLKNYKGSFSVRALECRTNVCAVEIANEENSDLVAVDPTTELDRDLYGPLTAYGYEVNPNSGVKVFLVLHVYARKH